MAKQLRRYTDVLSLLDMLRHNRLTLLNPSRWFDQNDARGLKIYSTMKGPGSVYALCLAEGVEQAHHWQLFAGHSHGLCIQFDREELVDFLDNLRWPVLHGPVIYQNLSEVRARKPIELDVLPFLKRSTFKAEEEYRVVAWEDEIFAGQSYTIPMPARMIRRVTLGPTMPSSLAATLKEIAGSLDGCGEIAFSISHLVNNESWDSAIADSLPAKAVW